MGNPWDINNYIPKNSGDAINNMTNVLNPNNLNPSNLLNDIINGIKGIGGGGAPTYTSPTMDPASSAMVAGQMNSIAGKGPQDYTNGLLQGTGAAGNIQSQTNNQNTENQSLGGGGINGMTEAIGAKAQKNFAKDQGRLQNQAQFQGQQMANQNMGQAAAMGVAMSDAQNHVNTQLNQLQLQSNQATYQTISGIMSGAGYAAGMYSAFKPSGSSPMTASAYAAANAPGEVGTTPSTYSGYTPPSQDYSGGNWGPGSSGDFNSYNSITNY